MYDAPMFAPQGWQCPVCKRVYSPDTTMCLFCGNTDTITTTGTCWIGDTPETMKQPTTGGKCSCWNENDYGLERCWGTKERDVCDCGGDKRKCNFNLYPEKGT